MNKYALLMLCCAAFSAFADSTINNNSSTNISAQSSSTMDRKKEISIDNTQKQVTGTEMVKLRAMGLSRTQLEHFSMTSDVPLSTILTPIIADYENKVANTDWNDPKNLKSPSEVLFNVCRLYTGVPSMPTSFPATLPNNVEFVARSGDMVTTTRFHRAGANEQVTIVGGQPTRFVNVSWLSNDYISPFQVPPNSALSYVSSMKQISQIMGRNLSTPAIPLRCIWFYSAIGKQVIDRLKGNSSNVGADKKSEVNETLFVNGDLQSAVDSAFHGAVLYYALMADPLKESREWVKSQIDKGCQLPTLLGVQNGVTQWRCGGVNVDSNTMTATQGGMTLLGDNIYRGESLSLNQVNGFELAQAMHVSTQTASKTATEQEKSKSTSMKKGHSTSNSISTDVGSGAGSGVSSGQ